MNVLVCVRVAVVGAMVRYPPDWATLYGKTTRQREQELNESTCLKRAMREQTVIAASDSNAANNVHRERGHHRNEAHTGIDEGETSYMEKSHKRGDDEDFRVHGLRCLYGFCL